MRHLSACFSSLLLLLAVADARHAGSSNESTRDAVSSATATAAAATAAAAAAPFPSYEERWYNQTLDHFRYTLPRVKFQQRYLYSDRFWGKPTAPTTTPTATAPAAAGTPSSGSFSVSPPSPPAASLPNGCPGPILFYTGNEGPITAFWAATGTKRREAKRPYQGSVVCVVCVCVCVCVCVVCNRTASRVKERMCVVPPCSCVSCVLYCSGIQRL